MELGFSYVGLIFLLMLFIPNAFWSKNQPKDYDLYMKNENRVLLMLERIGEIAVTCLLLIFSDFNINNLGSWSIWLAIAFVLMILYEIFWIRYYRSERRMSDFYSSILGVPVAGATLPVIAVILIAVYGRNPFLLAAGITLGIGHIGIHLQHKHEIEISDDKNHRQ